MENPEESEKANSQTERICPALADGRGLARRESATTGLHGLPRVNTGEKKYKMDL